MVDVSQLVSLAKDTATRLNLDPVLVCAVVEQESSWNQWAVRYEPQFFTKYVAPLYTNNKVTATEAYMRGMSWGLMQLMGEVAREEGFTGPFLSELCDPGTGLDRGCRHLSRCITRANGDLKEALGKFWNGGNNEDSYYTAVIARKGNYQ